jgi:hypothetical protein
MPDAVQVVPESRKRSRSPKSVIWDDMPIQQVVRPQGKGYFREVHPRQQQIMDSYKLEPVGGKPQSCLITVSSKSVSAKVMISRIIKELRRLAKKHVPQLVLFSQTEGSKVWLWTQLSSEVEPRARGGRRPRPKPSSDNGGGLAAALGGTGTAEEPAPEPVPEPVSAGGA